MEHIKNYIPDFCKQNKINFIIINLVFLIILVGMRPGFQHFVADLTLPIFGIFAAYWN